MKTAIELIAEERQRQIDDEGYTVEHDDVHVFGELPHAAIALTLAATDVVLHGEPSVDFRAYWPWNSDGSEAVDTVTNVESISSGDPIRDLVKAGALIAAEIERLQRAERSFQEEGWRVQL